MIGRLLESAVVAIVALFGVQMFRTYLGKRKIRSDFDYAMQVVAKEAVRRAKSEYRVHLDFAPGSIERLEAMLGSIHDSHLKKPLSEKELSLQSIRWGACIGEVLKRVQPGRWHRDSPKVGRGTMPLVFDSQHQAFPCSWVYKRIADGPQDNIILKFQVLCDLELQKHVGWAQAVIQEERHEQKK
jgi:hypothetical protein